MANSRIQTAIRSAVEYLSEHPDAAKSTDSAAVASLVDGLVVKVR